MTMSQKEKRELKAGATAHIEATFTMDGFEVAGLTKEGVAVRAIDSEDYFVIKVITKDSEKYPLDEAIDEKLAYDLEVSVKAKAKADAKAEREAKAKAKAEAE